MASKSYELLRPVAYYGLVPLALYLGMQGDVAPRSVRGYNIGTYMHRSWVTLPGFTSPEGEVSQVGKGRMWISWLALALPLRGPGKDTPTAESTNK